MKIADIYTEERDRVAYHYSYVKGKIRIELHRRLGSVDETDNELITLFDRGIDDRRWKDIDGYKFPVLSDPLNGLVLIFHINHHLRSGLGLRQIIDWMMCNLA